MFRPSASGREGPTAGGEVTVLSISAAPTGQFRAAEYSCGLKMSATLSALGRGHAVEMSCAAFTIDGLGAAWHLPVGLCPFHFHDAICNSTRYSNLFEP